MKYLVLVSIAMLAMASTCSVKEEVKSLQILRADCENLQADLDALGAKKWTKIIDDKVKACQSHGFWLDKRTKHKTFLD